MNIKRCRYLVNLKAGAIMCYYFITVQYYIHKGRLFINYKFQFRYLVLLYCVVLAEQVLISIVIISYFVTIKIICSNIINYKILICSIVSNNSYYVHSIH